MNPRHREASPSQWAIAPAQDSPAPTEKRAASVRPAYKWGMELVGGTRDHGHDADVIELHPAPANFECTNCRSQWFALAPASPSAPAAVVFTVDGAITGYSGQPVCIECGQRAHIPLV